MTDKTDGGTPRTDEFVVDQEKREVSIWDALKNIQNFARTLERESAELREQLAADPQQAEQNGETMQSTADTAVTYSPHRLQSTAPTAADSVEVPRDIAEKLQVHLTGMLVASCNCDTKMPDVDLHKVSCRYRQTSEAVEMIDRLLTAASGKDRHD